MAGYTTPHVKLARPSSTSVSFHRVLEAGQTGGWAVTYWPTASPSSTTTLTQAAVSAPAVNTRQILTATSLTPGTSYTYTATEGGSALNSGVETVFTTAGSGRFAIMSDCHSGAAWNGSAYSTSKDAFAAALKTILDTHGPAWFIHGGDWHQILHTYYVDEASVDTHFQFLEGLWDDIFRKYPMFYVIGNHEWVGRDEYGNDGEDNFWQLWNTRALKTYFANPATDIEELEEEWAASGEQGFEAWATAPNEPPFENCWTMIDGPVQVWGVDVYRYMHDIDLEPTVTGAARFRLGPSQEAWLKAGIAASTAQWKIVVTHQPTGGRHATESTLEDYGRGGVGVAEMSDYDWYDLWQWFESNGVDLVCGGHDHVNSVGRLKRSPRLPYLSMGSPFSAFPLSDGYERGYNADATTKNDTEETYYDADLDALYGSSFQGYWLINASTTRLSASLVRMYEDDDADPLVVSGEVAYTLTMEKNSQSESAYSGNYEPEGRVYNTYE